MGKITLELPWPPSVNHYYVRTKHGQCIGKRGKDYRRDVSICWHVSKVKKRYEQLHGRISLEVKAHPPDNRKRDLDNLLKCLLDAMEKAGVYHNDNHIKKLSIEESCVDRPKGKLIVNLETIGND